MTRTSMLLIALLTWAGADVLQAQAAGPGQSHHGSHGADHPAQEPAHSQPRSSDDHADHAQAPTAPALPAHVPPVTDADRAAAFPDVAGHAVHDTAINYFALVDRLEWQDAAGSAFALDSKGWIGRDRTRFWFRAEGNGAQGQVETGHAHVLYGRAVSPWWDLVAGIRQDVRPGSPQTWAAFGIQGLAPYWFQVEATAYLGAGGRTQLRLETEYDLLLTNRMILQPVVELTFDGKADLERHRRAGLSAVAAGLRVRYEIRRELAPYIGVEWHREYAEAGGHRHEPRTRGARLVAGLRFWL